MKYPPDQRKAIGKKPTKQESKFIKMVFLKWIFYVHFFLFNGGVKLSQIKKTA